MGFALNDIGTKTGMNALTSAVNPYNSPSILLSKKVEDTVYYDIKESTSHASGLNSSLDDLFVDSNVVLGRVQISTQYSTYLKEGIYNHPDVKKVIDVLNGHPCKITRLHNGKIRLEHFTHNPPRNNTHFSYIGNLDFGNKARGQYKSMIGVELSENMIVSMVKENVVNQQLCDMVLFDKNYAYTITEQGLFSFYNNGYRERKYLDDVAFTTFDSLDKLEKNPIFLEFLDLFLGK